MGATRSIGTKLYKLPNADLDETETLRIANLTSIGAIGLESDEIDITDLDSPEDYKEYIAGAKDPTTVEMEGNFKDESAMQKLMNLSNTRTVEAWRVDYPSGASWSFNAYIKSFTDGDKTTDGLITFTSGLRITGKPTFTPAGQVQASYTVRYYLDSLSNVAIASELPTTKYNVGDTITSSELVADVGATWISKYKPPAYNGTPTSNLPLVINGTASHDIVKVLYTATALSALAVTSVPLNSATNVAVESTIVLTFNYEVAVCPTPIVWNITDDSAVTCTSAWNTANTVLTLTPSTNLDVSSDYRVFIMGAEDIYERTLANTTITFTTEAGT